MPKTYEIVDIQRKLVRIFAENLSEEELFLLKDFSTLIDLYSVSNMALVYWKFQDKKEGGLP